MTQIYDKKQRQDEVLTLARLGKEHRAWGIVLAGMRRAGNGLYQIKPQDMAWAMAAHEEASQLMRRSAEHGNS